MVMDTAGAAKNIKISILILNGKAGADNLDASLESLAKNSLPASTYEVILIDPIPDEQWEKTVIQGLPFSHTIIRPAGVNPIEALRRALDNARGQFCLFLKAGLRADRGLIASHLEMQLLQNGVLGIGCVKYSLATGAGWHARWFTEWQNQKDCPLEQGKLSWQDCAIENFSAPKEALLSAIDSAPDLVQGCAPEMVYRLLQQRLPVVYLPEKIAVKEEARGYRDLATEVEGWGLASVQLWRRYPDLLPGLFGHFFQTSPRAVLLRRLLIALNVPSILLSPVGPLLKKWTWQRRWFEFLSEFWFWRGVRKGLHDPQTWKRLTSGVIILIYHAFASDGEPPNRYTVTLSSFTSQMSWLRRLGYRVISLEEYARCLREFRLPPERSIVLTIDDGYLDNYRMAYPVLKRFNLAATIFLISSKMGKTNDWDKADEGELVSRPIFSWDQTREMLAAGVSFGAHTRTHPFLSAVSPEQVCIEIEGSKEDIERELGVPVQVFSYPHGDYTPSIQAQVEQAGFMAAVTSDGGMNTPGTPPFALNRVEIRGTFSFLRFLGLLWSQKDLQSKKDPLVGE